VPWLPIAEDHEWVNVARESTDPTSLLTLYRRLLALRAEHAALSVGDYRPLAASGKVLAYRRELGAERLLVILNLGATPIAVDLPAGAAGGRILLSSALDRQGERCGAVARLRADEGLIISLE
jgi:alpha-glucosidase